MKVLSHILIVAMTASSISLAGGMFTPSESFAASKSYCKAFAKKQANKKANGGKVVVGAAVGAGLGAVAGALIGGNHAVTKGALIGGGLGAVGGGVKTNQKWKQVYNDSYEYCRTEM